MLAEVYRKIYKKLLALYPRKFRERLGESMVQTFDDISRERQSIVPMFFDTATGIVSERLLQPSQTITMKDAAFNEKTAAIVSTVLCLPAITLFSLLMLNIEPPFADRLRGEPDVPNIAGSLIAIFIFLLLPLALIVSLRPVVTNFRSGNGIAASPANLVIALVSFGYFAFVIISIIIDQYPCWMGVPNCD